VGGLYQQRDWFDREEGVQYSQRKAICNAETVGFRVPPSGRLAQLVRAPALQAGGRRFESCTAHHLTRLYQPSWLVEAISCSDCHQSREYDGSRGFASC
jgi:hypothetical protein